MLSWCSKNVASVNYIFVMTFTVKADHHEPKEITNSKPENELYNKQSMRLGW